MSNLKDVKRIEDISMEIGGRVRRLQLDMNAFAEIERRYGSVQAVMDKFQKQESNIATLRIMLWACLIHEEAVVDDMTGEPTEYLINPFQVGGWIKTPALLQEAGEKIRAIIENSLPDIENMPAAQNKQQKQEIKKNGNEQVISTGASQVANIILTPEELKIQEEQKVKNV